MSGRHAERGSALVLVLVIAVVAFILGGAHLQLVTAHARDADQRARWSQRLYYAEAGLGFKILEYDVSDEQDTSSIAWTISEPDEDVDVAVDIEKQTVDYRVWARITATAEAPLDPELPGSQQVHAWVAREIDPIWAQAIATDGQLQMDGDTVVGSFDSRTGSMPWDSGFTPGTEGDITINSSGEVDLDNGLDVFGEARLGTGVDETGIADPSAISEGVITDSPDVAFPDIDGMVDDRLGLVSSTSNDNGTIAVTNGSWSGNDLQTGQGGSVTMTAGDYHLDDLQLGKDSTLTIDTTGGDVTVTQGNGNTQLEQNITVEVIGDGNVEWVNENGDWQSEQTVDWSMAGDAEIGFYMKNGNFQLQQDVSQVDWSSDQVQLWMHSDAGDLQMEQGVEFAGVMNVMGQVQMQQDATVYGSIFSGTKVQMNQYAEVWFDEALLETGVLGHVEVSLWQNPMIEAEVTTN